MRLEQDPGQVGFEIAEDFDVQLPPLGLKQIQHAFDLLVETARMQVEIPQPRKAEEIVEQVLQPRDLLLNQIDFGQSPPALWLCAAARSSASRSMFMRMTDSGFLISCAKDPASSANSL